MRRREVLRAAGAGVGGSALVPAAIGAQGEAAQGEYGPLGRVGLEGAREAVVGADGTSVFVAVSDGFAVVDASDPSAPELVHEDRAVLDDHADGPLEGVGDVKVSGDRLAVAGPIEPAPSVEAAVVYDVADPANPSRETVYETGYFLHNCDIEGDRLYLCENYTESNRLTVVDADAGERLGRWSVTEVDEQWSDVPLGLWPLHDVTVRDDRAYLAYWDAGTYVLDVSDPADISLVTQVRGRSAAEFVDLSNDAARAEAIQPPGNDHFVAVNDDATTIAISVESWEYEGDDSEGGPGAVHLYDVPDEADAEAGELAVIDPPPTDDPTREGAWTTSHNCDFDGDRLYTSWYRGGVKLHDVADPGAPEELAAWRDSETTSFWTAQAAATCVVGSSRKDPRRVSDASEDGPGAALYTFPTDPTATPPPLSTETPTDSPTETRTDAGGTDPTTPSPGDETPDPATDSPTQTGGQPGFGLLAGATAAGYGAWGLLGEDEE
jgi:hypothetical protein